MSEQDTAPASDGPASESQPAPDARSNTGFGNSVVGAEQQQEQAQSQKEASPEIEALAREMGWSPQDEYRGNPDQWIPPDEFVKRTAKINKAQRDKLDRMEQTMQRMADASERIMKDRLAEQRRQLEQQFEAAVEVGDPGLARQTRAQIDALEKQTDAGPSHADKFKAENPWFQVNDEATAYAVAMADVEARKGATPEKQMQVAAEAVKKRFPELFPSETTNAFKQPPIMQGGSRAAPPRAKSYPPEVKRAAADFVRRGMVKSEAEYLKAYDAEQA